MNPGKTEGRFSCGKCPPGFHGVRALRRGVVSALTLKTVALRDVVVLPEQYGFSGAWCAGEPVPLAHTFRNGRQARRQAPYAKPVRTVEEPCIWGGVFHNHYGHFLIESMGSLYAFRQHPERRIAWRNGSPESIPSWAASVLRLTRCDRNGYVFVNEPTLFKDILFPLPGLMPDVWLTQEQADAFAVVEREPRKGFRVWLSRSDIGSDNIVFTNERELENLLASRGWMIFHPEKHSLEEQLEVLASGEVVMGCIGSAFHTLLLMKNPHSRYIVINRMNGDHEAHNLQFDLIAEARTENYYIWDVPKHDALPLYRRKTHHSWPWYAFDLDAIRQVLDASSDFSGSLNGYPGMVSIGERKINNSIRPLLCRLHVRLTDRFYYFYRRLRKAGRPIKEAWVSFQQKMWRFSRWINP